MRPLGLARARLAFAPLRRPTSPLRGAVVELGLFVCREFEFNATGNSNRRVTLKSRNCGAPGEIRTPDLLVRSQALYPTELRAQAKRYDIDRNGKRPAVTFCGPQSTRKCRLDQTSLFPAGYESDWIDRIGHDPLHRDPHEHQPTTGFGQATPLLDDTIAVDFPGATGDGVRPLRQARTLSRRALCMFSLRSRQGERARHVPGCEFDPPAQHCHNLTRGSKRPLLVSCETLRVGVGPAPNLAGLGALTRLSRRNRRRRTALAAATPAGIRGRRCAHDCVVRVGLLREG